MTKIKKNKKPWTTRAAMQQVYEMNLWGTDNSDFYSGAGSHDANIAVPYIDAVVSFLKSLEKPVVVCDLGCGDFNIGKELVPFASKYVAVDIVPALIERNKEKFIHQNLEFHCLDLAQDNLPGGDIAIIRQVLQHVSNAEIKKIVRKLNAYKYIIFTEHIPEGNFTPNLDIISGQGTRLKKQSGVDLLASPFDFKVKTKRDLVASYSKEYDGIVVTTVYEVF